MNRQQFDTGLLSVQQLFGSRYKPDTKEVLWERLRTWDNEAFLKVVEILPTKVTRLPAAASYIKIAHEQAEGSKTSKVDRVHVQCEDCKSTGIRQWLRDLGNGQFDTPVARCECLNGENFPSYPSMVKSKDAQGFKRFLDPHEIPLKARMEAAGQQYLDSERQAEAAIMVAGWRDTGKVDWKDAARFITEGKEIPDVDLRKEADLEAERQRQKEAIEAMAEEGPIPF